jgi:hypothetical protein
MPNACERSDLVRDELLRVLESPSFRSSKRCQDFLRHVVEAALEGRSEALRERSLGVDVFERPAGYDTGDDAIVRVKANEVRKRLAQCYSGGGAHPVRIELPAGSYTPEFHFEHNGGRARSRRLGIAFAIALAPALAALAWYAFAPGRSPDRQFWAPLLASPRPVLICSANPVVYHLSARAHRKYLALHPDLPPGPYAVELPASEIDGNDVIPAIDQYVGFGDAATAAQLSALFASMGKVSHTRIGSDISFTDLQNSPAVLIGAYSNPWALQLMRDFRFVFDRQDGAGAIRDRADSMRVWIRSDPAQDYAIVSRVFEASTGQLLITAAGVSQYGTQAAGDFLANPPALVEALRGAPAGWQRRNIQFVLHTRVIGRTPTPARVLAVHFW